ncbi:MAG: MFS transporter, partial [Mogibacterium sp.]|nr:MFS transporter [Mogibacterium sp.]
PLILTKTFHLNETFSGAIMAADNVLALFLLPFFGTLSDRTNTKLGKRTPYILGGTLAAVILLNILPLLDNSYYAAAGTGKMIAFVVALGLLLISMGTYRSPAVALMPDVTPKPLRSRANAIINLMGAVGGIIYLAIAAVMYPNSKVLGLDHVNYQPLFIVVALIMAVSIIVMKLTINEPKLVAENRALEAEHPEWNLAEDDGSGNEVLPANVKRSLGFLLASIALWFIGYNGITTWFTTYVDKVMGQGLGGASTCLLIATGGAIISYIPIGSLAHRIGRKRTIMIGIVLLASCFAAGYFLTTAFSSINAIMFVVFALVGFAWAAINVNSLPMVVEMCRGSDIGKFTGYYYTASMAAQVVTPILAGFLMRNISYKVLFPYAALFVLFSFMTMTQVKHGDAAPEVKKGLEAFEDMDD